MGHGGKRAGSGRKPLEKRETKTHVLAAAEVLDKLQPLSAMTLSKCLEAVHKDGHPDYATRVKAAAIILNKRIPDVARQEITGKDGEKLELGITYFPSKKPVGA